MDEILDAILRLSTPINHDILEVGISSNHVFISMYVGTGDTFGTEIALHFEIIEDIWLSVGMFAYGAFNKFDAF